MGGVMGCGEDCSRGRNKYMAQCLEESMLDEDTDELRQAIWAAEHHGIESQPARHVYSELEKKRRQSASQMHAILMWALATQDGALLCSVIQEVEAKDPANRDLSLARQRLKKHQDELMERLRRCVRVKDKRNLSFLIDKARKMGVPDAVLEPFHTRFDFSTPPVSALMYVDATAMPLLYRPCN